MPAKIILRNECADYLDIGTKEKPEICLLDVCEDLEENFSAKTLDRAYTSRASAVTFTTGYQTKFPYKTDIYADEKVGVFLAKIGEEQQLNVTLDFIRVKLWVPIENKENTFYARKFKVAVAPSNVGGKGGEALTTSGDFNAIADVIVGEFNTETKTFTSASEAAAAVIGG